MSQIAQLAGLHSPPRTQVSLISHSDEEDDDEVLSQAVPSSQLVFPSQRVVDHPLAPSLSTPRPTSSSGSGSSRRSSALPSRSEAESEKKFDNFIQLRVSSSRPNSATQLGGGQTPVPPQAAPESPRPGSSAQNLRAPEVDRSQEALQRPRPLQRQDEPLGARVHQAVLEALQESRKPPVAARSQAELRQEVPLAAPLQSTEASAPFVATSYDDDDRTSSVDSSSQPDPNPLSGSDGSDEVAAADLVQATADGAVPPVVQAATGLPAASADVPGQAPVVPADGATAAVQQDVQPRSSRQKKKEESSFPTRFSPRKIRGSSHKYADTYYY